MRHTENAKSRGYMPYNFLSMLIAKTKLNKCHQNKKMKFFRLCVWFHALYFFKSYCARFQHRPSLIQTFHQFFSWQLALYVTNIFNEHWKIPPRRYFSRQIINNSSDAEISRFERQAFFLSSRGSFTPNISCMRGNLQRRRHQNDP